jgi:hypothetical protein
MNNDAFIDKQIRKSITEKRKQRRLIRDSFLQGIFYCFGNIKNIKITSKDIKMADKIAKKLVP